MKCNKYNYVDRLSDVNSLVDLFVNRVREPWRTAAWRYTDVIIHTIICYPLSGNTCLL